MGADFSGYATKAGLKCSDGRTITPDAFKDMDGKTVPLVWQHAHSDHTNVLGYGKLEARPDGMYVYGYFNETPAGANAKQLVQHGDIKSLSIFANSLVERAKTVLHGVIREVSLVLSGANPGALIDWVQIQHSDDPDDITTSADEAIIHTGLEITVGEDEDGVEKEESEEDLEHADGEGRTLQQIFDDMDQDEKDLVHYMVAQAMGASTSGTDSAAHSDDGGDNESEDPEGSDDADKDEGDLEHKEGTDGDMTRNVFEQQDGNGGAPKKHSLSHADMQGIFADAAKGGSLKEAVEAYALKHGIESIETLFPDPKTLQNTPEFNARRMEWVTGVWNGTRKSPFSRVKSIVADLTQDQARALGYIKGNYKKEEWFGLTSRVTTPTTVYKKQQLDRDDILDVADFDVVAWLKAEMRMMLMEELARAILIGDGRDPGDADKIKDPGSASEGAGIRAIKNENELYATTVNVPVDGGSNNYMNVVEAVMRARRYYKGSGSPNFYTTASVLVEMLLTKDSLGRRQWANKSELAAALMVNDIIEVEVMETEPDLLGIIVNLSDYNVGADRGGEVNLFDDFDIDYNQYKYLIETRISGALTKIKSAMVIMKEDSDNTLVEPQVPTFVSSTGVITIPSQTGVVYKDATTGSTLSSGAQTALTAGSSKTVVATPASGYYFATSEGHVWEFKRPAS